MQQKSPRPRFRLNDSRTAIFFRCMWIVWKDRPTRKHTVIFKTRPLIQVSLFVAAAGLVPNYRSILCRVARATNRSDRGTEPVDGLLLLDWLTRHTWLQRSSFQEACSTGTATALDNITFALVATKQFHRAVDQAGNQVDQKSEHYWRGIINSLSRCKRFFRMPSCGRWFVFSVDKISHKIFVTSSIDAEAKKGLVRRNTTPE